MNKLAGDLGGARCQLTVLALTHLPLRRPARALHAAARPETQHLRS